MELNSNLPIEEQYHEAGLAHADAEHAAQMLEETKTRVLSQYKMTLIAVDTKLSDARAETLVKAGPEWGAFIKAMVDARRHANIMRVKKDTLRMKFSRWIAEDANHRQGMRMT
jgi:hypothetical protein